jgi:hypothetical protein
MVWMTGRRGPVGLREHALALWPAALLAAAAALGAAVAFAGADALRLSPGWQRLLFVGGSAALAWTLLCFALRPARDALLGKAMA